MKQAAYQSAFNGFFICCSFVLSLFLTGLNAVCQAEELLKVHEWGTCTSFQDERGTAFNRINADDEPVPKFVHQLDYSGRFLPTDMPRRSKSKGIDKLDPSVTMRLETPVTYFHLPKSVKEMTLDVHVEFLGGWLTEYFPNAVTRVNGQAIKTVNNTALKLSTISRLTWSGIRLGSEGVGPSTQDHVWLAPRNVRAAQVTIGDESERFLFYRGVGHRDAPIRVVRRTADNQLELRNSTAESIELANSGMKLSHLWLVEIKPDGSSAYRPLSEVSLSGQPDHVLTITPSTFSDGEFSKENHGRLRAEMYAAIQGQGLFDDEATAMLATWDLSYFQSPGLRLFFLLPQTWTDRVLPLKLSVPAEVTRVMLGRIELVTPRQRQLLQKITELPLEDLKVVTGSINRLLVSSAVEDHEKYNALASGRGDPRDLGVAVPAIYQAFLDLGRFRTALLLNAAYSGKTQNSKLSNLALEIESPGAGIKNSLREQQQSALIQRR